MKSPNSIVISGDLGGGKTTVSSQVADALGIRRVSMGQLYRNLAQRQGLSAVQMNLNSERDEAIDDYIDGMQADLAKSGEALIVDSRLAWNFFPTAFKVHLIADPIVAAQRVMLRPQSEVEAYNSTEEAVTSLRARHDSERNRFLKKYGVDKARLRNYDLVCDTTHVRPEQVTDYVIKAFVSAQRRVSSDTKATPRLLLDPLRIYPSAGINALRGLWQSSFVEQIRQAGAEEIDPIDVAYTGECFFSVNGHRRLSAALQCDFPLIPAELVAEDNEKLALGLTAREYFENEIKLATVYDWEAAHNIHLRMPSHLLSHAEVEHT